MTAELKTAAEVRQHAREVQRKIDEQHRAGVVLRKLSAPPPVPEPEPPPAAAPPVPTVQRKPEPDPDAPKPKLVRHPIRLIADIAARHFSVSSDEVFGPSRLTKYVGPRHVAFYVAHRFSYSWPAIGHWMNKDHTTALSGTRNIGGCLKRKEGWAIEAVDAVGSEAAARLGLSWQPAETHFEHAAVIPEKSPGFVCRGECPSQADWRKEQVDATSKAKDT